MEEERPKGQEYSDTAAGEPDPQNAGSEEVRARTGGTEHGGSHGGEPIEEGRELSPEERFAREQAEEILRESDARIEDPSTFDPDDDTIERRRSEETAGGAG